MMNYKWYLMVLGQYNRILASGNLGISIMIKNSIMISI